MATYAKLIYNGKIQTVALMEGLESEEVTSLLKTVFGINGNIVGIMAEKGLVIPISLVCRSPQVIPNSTCKILVSKPDVSVSPQQQTSIASSKGQSKGRAIEEEYDESLSDDEEAAAQSVVNEIGQFLDSIRQKNQLTKVQHQLLRRLLTERSALLFAAYSVAISAGDWEYLLEVCKDIATSLQTEEGRTACEAQDEVLQVCDQLYLQSKITESQLLYLRHLTLIRDSSVAKVYDDFQEHGSVTLFAKALYDVANSHPFRGGSSTVATDGGSNRGDTDVAVTGEDDDDDVEEEDVDEDEDEDEDEDQQDEAVKNDFSSGLIGVIVLMLRSETLSRTEAQVLLEMVQREDDYVMAAYELYLRDNNMEDLQDTLMRCVRLEIRKRVTDIQERELATLQREREEEKQQQEDKQYDEATDADEEGDQDVDSEDYESGKLATASTTRGDFGIEAISLDSLLSELGVENLWRGTVPEQFVQAVFIAVFRKFLSLDQARALCDLYQANYDLVHAAWEVYVVQKDTVDFIDTLRRIVRDLNLQDISEQYAQTRQEAQAAANQASRAADRAREAAQAGRQSAQTASGIAKSARARGTSDSDTSSGESDNAAANNLNEKKREVEAAKAQALQAIDQAKSELLKHSLEMMVKQKLISEKSADDLYQRHLEGDKLTDAAIEAYASDRDVNEFIDTLQMLAMHSREELEVLMGSAVAQQEKQEAAKQGKDAATSAAQTELAAAERYLADAALQQIEEIVSEMLKNDMISAPVASAFATLITDRDPRLVEAYQEFMKNRNGTELIDALLKIVIASVQEGGRLSKPTSNATSTASAKAQESTGSTGGAQVLDKFDQKQIVDILFQSNAISAQSYSAICRLIEEGDASVGRIFRRYETTKDVMTLVQDLQAMQLSSKTANADKNDEDNVDQQADDDEDGEEEDEEEGDDNQEDEDDANAIEKRFMGIIQGMALSELEQTALRLAIAENDPAIRNAIDAFRQDLDEERLVTSMRTAARAVIHRTLSSANHAEDDEEDDEENNGSDDDEDDEGNEEDINDDDKNEEDEDGDDSVEEMLRLSRSHYQGGDEKNDKEEDEDQEEEDEDEEEEDEEDEDEEEEDEEEDDNDGLGNEGVSLITSKSARDHVFPILVQELVKENIIARKDGATIMQQFAANNPIISTALDRYDANNDMAQLVDALQQMVENIDTN